MSDPQEAQPAAVDGNQPQPASPSAATFLTQAVATAAQYVKQASVKLVEYRGRRRPVKAVEFGVGELVKPLTSLKISVMGEYLNLPGAVAAVITEPNGTQNVHRTGGLLNYPPGRYRLQYVDLRQQRLHLPNLRAAALDTVQVTLSVDILWQVINVVQVVNMEQPHATWRSACQAAVIHFIQSNPHDRLVPAPNAELIRDEEIAKAIRLKLSTAGLNAFRIIEVKVTRRQGDPARMKENQEASDPAKHRQELEAQIDGILAPARQLAQQLQQASQSQPLTRQQLIEWLEVSGTTFSRLAAALRDPASTGEDQVFAFMAHAFDPVLPSPNGAEVAARTAAPVAGREPEASREPEAGRGVQS